MTDAGVGDDSVTGEEPTREEDPVSATRREPEPESVPHSALVGFMSVPVHRWLPIRRSTLLMVVAFLGFGTWCLLYPPYSGPDRGSSGTTIIPGFAPPTTTTTSTTTTQPAPTTTTTTTVRGSSSTTTTSPRVGSTTSTAGAGSTTTTLRGTASSTTTSTSTAASSGGATTTTGG